MNDNPIVINNHQSSIRVPEYRPYDPTKHIAHIQQDYSSRQVSMRSPQESISIGRESNKSIMRESSNHPAQQHIPKLEFRSRQKHKEIQQEMRFNDKSSLDRLQSYLKNHVSSQLYVLQKG